MRTKQLAATVKALSGSDPAGTFEAIVAVFDNVDSYGDVILPGAFAADLAEKAAAGKKIPVIWSHKWDDPFSHIGEVLEAREVEKGLWIKGLIDLENPTGAQCNKLLTSGRIGQFSFAYDTIDADWGERDGEMVYLLRQLAVHEVGPCLLGVNRETELLAAKATALAEASADGREITLSGRDELKAARDTLDALLASTETPAPAPAGADEKATGDAPGASVKTDQDAAAPATATAGPSGSTGAPATATSASRRAKATATLMKLKEH